MRDSSLKIQEIIAHAQEKVSLMWFIGIYEFSINGHTILQVDNEENFTFELALLKAASTGHNEAVQLLLDLTDNTGHCNEEGTTPLMLASEGGYEPVVKSLLLAGANVNSQNNDGWTALMEASKYNHITIIHTLLEVGADPHLQISDGRNALMIASINGHHQVVQQLLRKNVDYNCQQKRGITALMYSSIKGHCEVVELLLNAQDDPNIQGKVGWTALMLACLKGHIKVVEQLLNKEANPNIQNTSGQTALRFANQSGHFQVVELLLKQHANPNVRDTNAGCTELHFAVLGSSKINNKSGFLFTEMTGTIQDYIKIVQLLIGHSSIDIDVVTDKSFTSLMFASMYGCTEVVELLLEAGANPNIPIKTSTTMKDINGCTALMLACQHGYSKIAELLLNKEADPNIENTSGQTALRFANQNGHFQVVELLLKRHANPNVRDTNAGCTQLHFAVFGSSKMNNKSGFLFTEMTGAIQDYIKIVQLLTGHSSIDIDAVTDEGFTNLMFASMYGCTEVVELLLKAGANPNIQIKTSTTMKDMIMSDETDILLQPQVKSFLLPNFSLLKGISVHGWTALMFASWKGHLDIVQMLLRARAKPDLRAETGDTALLCAAMKGLSDIVQQLLEYGANPNISNRDGRTSLNVAVVCLSIQQRKLKLDPTISKEFEIVNPPGSYEDYRQIVQLLIAQPNVDILVNTNLSGYTSLHIASMCSCTDAVELLLWVSADPNIQSHKVETSNNLSILPSNILLQPQLKTFFLLSDFQTISGFTALMFASGNGHLEIVQLLLKAKAKPDLQTENGETALYLAVMKGHPDIVQLLLKYGAYPNICNIHGRTAIHAATYCAGLAITTARGGIAYGSILTTITSGTYEHHLKTMKLLIAQPNIKINETIDGVTTLMTASSFGNEQIVELLLQAGADPNMSIKTSMDKFILAKTKILFSNQYPTLFGNEMIGWTALMLACKGGHLEVVKLLLKAKANPDHQMEAKGITALIIAVQKGFSDIVQQLLEYGADPNIGDRRGSTAIHSAVGPNDSQSNPSNRDENFTRASQKLEIIQLLFESGVNVNIQNIAGISPLMMACMDSCSNSTHVVELLLKNEADPNIQTTGTKMIGLTALMFACVVSNVEVIKLLLKAKANPNQQQTDGMTALMFEAKQGHPHIVQQLLEYGADPNISDRSGRTAIHYIMMLYDRQPSKMMSDKLEILQLLIARGINLNIKDRNGKTALMAASFFRFTEAVKLLLQNGADPNIEQHKPVNITSSLPKTIRFTALIYASGERMNAEVVKLLLKANANPNQENALALMIAAQQGYPDIVQQLLKYGADPNSISDIDGSTALHCVLESQKETPHKDNKEKISNQLAIIQQLIESGADIINIQNEDGMTALMMATDEGLSEIVELLLQNGADPNVHCHKGRTALMYACSHGNSEVVESLLKFIANPLLVDNDGFTASIHALCSGYKDLGYKLVNDRDFSQNELKCLLIMDLLEGNQIEAISRLDEITDLTTEKKELMISCVVGSLEDVVGKLHESNLHPDTTLVGGLTLLMIASSCGHIELVEYLVIIEANINQRDMFWKYTPIFYAILGSGLNELVEFLLENGADINAVAGKQTPLDLANSSSVDNQISSLLLKSGGQTFAELIVDIQPPLKTSPNLTKFSDQVKSLIQDTVVKGEHTEYTHT